MAALATKDQVRALQTVRRRLGLDDVAYRAALAGFSVVSTKELSIADAATLLDRLNGSAGASNAVQSPGGRPLNRRATGPFAGKLQALWIAGWNLGIVRDRDDTAMLAFVARQTGIEHTRFLRDPMDAAKAIEAVKAMLARDGGVTWPKRKGPEAVGLKRAVVEAQWRRLRDLGAITPEEHGRMTLLGIVDESATAAALDDISRALGVRVRKAVEAQA